MRHLWTSLVSLGVFVSVVLPSDVSWARPKKPVTTYTCYCACKWEDELGKEHFGPDGAVRFTESSIARCIGHACTTTTPTGTHKGTTWSCRARENKISVPPGGVQGNLQQVPSTPGGMPGLAPGAVQRRGVEGEQPTSSEKEGK